MKYRVFWSPIAILQLADLWLKAPDRNALSRDSRDLERFLSTIPLYIGESRTSSVHRVAGYGCIGAIYEVIEDDKRVLVQGVFAIG